MNAEPPIARFQMEHQPRRPGYARRYPTTENVKAYQYTQRYDTLSYWVFALLFAAIAIAFGFAAHNKPMAGVFATFFAVVSFFLFLGIFGGHSSGITIDDKAICWWTRFSKKTFKRVELKDVREVKWINFENERIYLTFADSSIVKIDHRFFGNGAEVLAAIAVRDANIMLLEHDFPYG